MIGALGTLLFFAVTPVFARRAALLLGSLRANFWRLLIATVVLGLWAHFAGRGTGGITFGWFFLGGVIGFGIGGVSMFQSLPRLGSNLSTLIVQCGSAVVAAGLEWRWLGTHLTPAQIVCAALTLIGITIGLLPRSLPRVSPAQWVSGLLWALLSATGQGVGVVISRKAFFIAREYHDLIDPGTASYQRALGGLLVAAVVVLIFQRRATLPPPSAERASPWVIANALSGPVLGVACLQWALSTTPAGIVQPIVAAAPLGTIPFAAWLEKSRPRPAYYLGATLAVLGVAGLFLYR